MSHMVVPTQFAASLVILSEPRPAKCCDGRAVMVMVNAGGKTTCVMCVSQDEARKRKEK